MLEIGTGWGELAIRAARRGASVRSITLSEEQRVLARARVAAAGLADRVDIDLCDYRAATGTYDAVVSVEMIEAVGFDFLDEYFATLDRLLAPGGRVGLQAITMPHDRMIASRDTYTWIHKYVFPGGQIPSVEALTAAAGSAGLDVVDSLAFGPHYAETLRLWRERFGAVAGEVDALGFDATFRKMWTFYLAYSEAGFRAKYLDVYQFVLHKGSFDDRSARRPEADVPVRMGSPRSSRSSSSRCSGAPCRSASAPGTAARSAPRARPSSSCGRGGPCAGCSGTRGS